MYFLIIPLKALDIDLVSTTIVTTTAHYATARIAEKEVHTFVDHLESALRFIIEHPERLVGEVELINDQEMRLLIDPQSLKGEEIDIDSPNHPDSSDNGSLPVHNVSELIQLQVERTPHKIAASELIWN